MRACRKPRRQQKPAAAAPATRITRSRLIGDRDVCGVVPMTAPGARRGRLIPASFPQSLGQHWLRQSVGRQSSLTEKQLSNRCANREIGQKARKPCYFTRLVADPRRRSDDHMPCICAIAHMQRMPPGQASRPYRRAQRRPTNRQQPLISSGCGSASPSGRYCRRLCAACRSRSLRLETWPRTPAPADD
jgi:hypothetical protein